MTKTLYFGNLTFRTEAADLERLVTPLAEVQSAHVATERETGRSRGFGFVDVPADAAERVISALNGSDFDGRTLTVNEARPRGERPPGPRYGDGGRGPRRSAGGSGRENGGRW
jgi:RNA recognition motif-containing protein